MADRIYDSGLYSRNFSRIKNKTPLLINGFLLSFFSTVFLNLYLLFLGIIIFTW